MEQINFGNTYFSTKGMMPENGDTITLLWARKIVKNIANAYGIIGTVNFHYSRGYRIINLSLSQRYLYPPCVYLYYMDIDGSLSMPIETMSILGEFETIIDSKQYEVYHKKERKPIWSLIAGDSLIILNASRDVSNVYYRIVGV